MTCARQKKVTVEVAEAFAIIGKVIGERVWFSDGIKLEEREQRTQASTRKEKKTMEPAKRRRINGQFESRSNLFAGVATRDAIGIIQARTSFAASFIPRANKDNPRVARGVHLAGRSGHRDDPRLEAVRRNSH